MTFSVHELLKATKGRLVSGYPTDTCARVSIDTRTLHPGDVFFALKGPRFDGHAFVGAALQKKARVVVLENLNTSLPKSPEPLSDLIEVTDTLKALQETGRYAREQAKNTAVIGLTGSNGKTTTKEMLAAILRRAGKTLATRGNLNNHIGLPLMLCELDSDHKFAVLELGTSKVGDMDVLVQMARPQIAIITNVGKDHLEFLGTPDGVLKENRKLFDALPADGIAIINLDDPLLKGLAGKLPCKTVTYGLSKGAEVSATNIRAAQSPLRFTLKLGNEALPAALNVTGEIQILNAIAAAAVAFALKVDTKDIVEGLAAFKPSAMRMEELKGANGTIFVNDAYNANPSSMHASIDSFCRSYPDRPKWLVLGDMRELGAIARQEHRELGKWIATLPVDRVYLYGRDTRFIKEAIPATFKGIVERYRKKRYLIEALKKSLSGAAKPAILLKASRRMQLEQVTNALLSLPS